MKSTSLMWAIISGLGMAMSDGAQAATVRRVEVVRIDRSFIETRARAQTVTAGQPAPASFTIHALSRRVVEESKPIGSVTDGLAEKATAASLSDAGFEATDPRIPDAQRIAIPTWMLAPRHAVAEPADEVRGCSLSPYRPAGFLDAATEIRRVGFYDRMSGIACDYGLPVDLFDALIIRESGYRSGIESVKRAVGLTQLMPLTARELGVDRYDDEQNLRGGARYLRQQIDRFGHYHLALAAYNAGPRRIRGGMIPPIYETQNYVAAIMRDWRRLESGTVNAAAAPRLVAASRRAASRIATVQLF